MSTKALKINRSLLLKPQAALPSDPQDGEIAYSSDKFKVYQNGSWVDMISNADTAYVGTFPQPSKVNGFYQLAAAHERIQMISPTENITIRLPTDIASGETWQIINRSSYDVRVLTEDGLSTDYNWILRSSAANNEWMYVCWSPLLGLFCAVAFSGTGNRVMTSPDGITWTSRTSAADNNWTSVCWSPELELFCAVASSGTGNRVMTSPNGTTWTSRTPAADNDWTSVCWSPELELFCAVAGTGTGDRVMTSPDGVTWTSRTSAADNEWSSVCWSPELELFCAVALTGTGDGVMTSPDGTTWTSRTPAANNEWSSVCWSPDLELFCAVSTTGTNKVMTSPDGITWTSRTDAANVYWTSVCWSPELELFCAVASSGTGNRVMTSPNGTTWTSRTSAANNSWISACWSPGLGMFCAVANSGTGNRVMTSFAQFEAIRNGYLTIVSLQDNPISTAHWRTVEGTEVSPTRSGLMPINKVFGYIGVNPEAGGSSPFQLFGSHKRVQVLCPEGDIIINLPPDVRSGEICEIYNRSTYNVTIKSWDGDGVDIINTGYFKATALQDYPTDTTHWHILDVYERYTYSGEILNLGSSGYAANLIFARNNKLITLQFPAQTSITKVGTADPAWDTTTYPVPARFINNFGHGAFYPVAARDTASSTTNTVVLFAVGTAGDMGWYHYDSSVWTNGVTVRLRPFAISYIKS